MKPLKIALFAAIIIIAGAFAVSAFSLNHIITKKTTVATNGFAVIELFTSEGCSSCPPADALVSRIQKENADKPVYILAYHVDYWNRLGWRDPYSAAAYSQRQSKYSNWMHSSSVYTPQIVVNGRKEFVGSEEGTLRNAIKSAEQTSTGVQLHLIDVKADGNRVSYQYHTDGAAGSNTNLVVALVQKVAKTNVGAGENSGRTLSHVQLVRQLQNSSLNSSGSGSGSIDIPKGLGRDLEVIAFLQDQSNGQITAAFKTTLDGSAL